MVPLTQSDGGVVKHPECVVYDKSQTLVEYAIWYKHTPECLCTHCVTLSRRIIVRTLFNEQIELQMRGLDTIKDLKVKISNTSFIPEDEQEIIFKSEFLCDAHTLAHYEIATGSVLNLVVHSKMGRSVSLNDPKPSAIQRFVDSASRSLGSTSRFLLIGRVVLLVLLVQYLLYISRSVFKVTPPLWESKVLLVLNTHTHALRARFIGKQCFSLSSSLPSQEIRLSLFG